MSIQSENFISDIYKEPSFTSKRATMCGEGVGGGEQKYFVPFIANNFNLISVKLTVAGGNQNTCKIWFGKNRPKFRMNRSRLPLFDSVMQAFMLANQSLFNLHVSLSLSLSYFTINTWCFLLGSPPPFLYLCLSFPRSLSPYLCPLVAVYRSTFCISIYISIPSLIYYVQHLYFLFSSATLYIYFASLLSLSAFAAALLLIRFIFPFFHCRYVVYLTNSR